MTMIVNDIKKVKPAKEYVVVKHIEPDTDNNLYFAKSDESDLKNAPLSFGEVISKGPLASEESQCPGVEVGDSIVHNRFSGSHIATKDLDELYKIMSGYGIMAKIDDINKIDESSVHPVSNRLLLVVKFLDETNDGVYISGETVSDPRLEDLGYGTILKLGPSCKLGYKVGDIVAFQPHCGENVRSAQSTKIPALRVLNEEDVLLTV